jgi:hypothetical protein
MVELKYDEIYGASEFVEYNFCCHRLMLNKMYMMQQNLRPQKICSSWHEICGSKESTTVTMKLFEKNLFLQPSNL